MPTAAPSLFFVDLDGTLVRSDLLFESAVVLLKRSPLHAFAMLFWLARGGRALLKAEIAARVELDIETLPFDDDVLAFLRARSAEGATLILATAAGAVYAHAVAKHLRLFARVISSTATRNLSGREKLAAVLHEAGPQEFCYIGNDYVDLAIWRVSRYGIVVGGRRGLVARARKVTEVSAVMSSGTSTLSSIARLLRPHQWTKNLLVFVPLLTAHRLFDARAIGLATLGVVAFSLAASSVYIVNDVMDLAADRAHPTKRARPIASGVVSIPVAFFLAVGLLAVALVLAFSLSAETGWITVAYAVLSNVYTLRLKQIVLADVMCLATLYTIRLLAGGLVTGVPISQWLLAFSMFLFTSLAMAKRLAELRSIRHSQIDRIKGRGYHAEDQIIVAVGGLASGLVAVLVFVLYVQSDHLVTYYANPSRLWFIAPLIYYWILRIYVLANRGKLPSDPVVFALRDVQSFVVLGLTILCVVLAK